MMPPSGMALAAMTVMLWLIWSDIIRGRRGSQILYAARVALFLVVTGVLLLNLFRYPNLYSNSARVVTAIAAGVGVVGAVYFGRRLTRRM